MRSRAAADRPRGVPARASHRPVYVGCILGPVCDPHDDEALHRLRPATTYIGKRLRLDPPEEYDDPANGPAPSVERYWAATERRDSLDVWRTRNRRRRETRRPSGVRHALAVLLVAALVVAAFWLGTYL